MSSAAKNGGHTRLVRVHETLDDTLAADEPRADRAIEVRPTPLLKALKCRYGYGTRAATAVDELWRGMLPVKTWGTPTDAFLGTRWLGGGIQGRRRQR